MSNDYFSIWAWTMNEGRASSVDQAEAAVKKVVNSFDPNGNPSDTIGLQEIDEGDKYDEHSLWTKHLPHYQWAGWNKMVPVGIHPDWQVVNSRSTDVHPGLEGVTPARTITDCLLQHTKHTWAKIGWINSHAVAGAFTHPDQTHERERRDYWYWWWGAIKMRCADYVRAGHSVILTMDSNNPDQPKIHDHEKRLVHSGFDYILAVEPDDPSVHFEATTKKTVQLPIDDHDAHAVAIRLHQR